MNAAHRIALLVISLATAAEAQAPRVRDSSGVRIMEHATIRNTPLIELISPRASFELGGLRSNPLEEFDARQPFIVARRLSDGRLVATSWSDVKLFTPSGSLARTIGRAGEGPGEFGQLRDVCLGVGDTIVVVNYNRPRASIFTPAGEHVRTFTFDGYVPRGGCFSDGSLLVRTNTRPNPATRFTPQQAAAFDRVSDALRIGLDGKSRGVVGTFAEETYAPVQTMGNSYVQGQLIYTGDGRAPEVRIHDAAGRLVRLLRWNDPATPVTPEMIDDETRARMPTDLPPEERARRLEIARARPYAPTLPFYSVVYADPAGRIWVMDPTSSPSPRLWTVFAADGALLGRVAMPSMAPASGRATELAGFLGNEVMLRWRDADGAVHLSFHAVLGPGR